MGEPSLTRALRCFVLRWLPWLLTLLLLAHLILMISHYKVDFPYQEGWFISILLYQSEAGTLSLHDFWGLANEHRPAFPKLLLLWLASITQWSASGELALNLAVVVCTFFLLAYQVRRTGQSTGTRGIDWLILVNAVLVLSLTQYHNWLVGWQLVIFLNVLAVVAGIVLLANPGLSWIRLAAAAGMGLVATYSFGSGLLFWPIGFGILCLANLEALIGRRTRLVFWTCLSLMVTASYLYRYETPACHRVPLSWFLEHVSEYATFVVRFLGSALFPTHRIGADWAGGLSLLLLVGASWFLVWKRHTKLQVLLPYLALSLYSLLNAVMIGIGRVEISVNQATASRYVTLSNPFWIAVAMLLFLLLQAAGTNLATGKSDARFKVAQWTLLCAFAVLMVHNMEFGKRKLRHFSYRFLLPARHEYLAVRRDDPCVQRILNALDPAVAEELEESLREPDETRRDQLERIMDFLRKHRLSIFRDCDPPH